MSHALFVDLPNFYSSLLESRIDEPRTLRDYFLQWFDFDRLAERLTGGSSPVWIFYSGRRFGPKPHRIEDAYLDSFISRCNSQRGVTALDVNIPGEQRELAKYRCENCGHEGVAHWESEKGVDSSLTVRLFDTAESWDVSYLLSGDADFVPAVAALRRRGKVVIGAGFASPSSALVRETYFYHDLASDFFRDDLAAFRLFGSEGLVHEWFQAEVKAPPDPKDPTSAVTLAVLAQYLGHSEWVESNRILNLAEAGEVGPRYQIYFIYDGPIDISARSDAFEQFKNSFPAYCPRASERDVRHMSLVSLLAWNGVERRLSALSAKLPQVTHTRHGNVEFRWNATFPSTALGQ